MMNRPFGKVSAQAPRELVSLCIASQRGRNRLAFHPILIPDAGRFFATSSRKFLSNLSHLLKFRSLQATNLLFKSPDTRYLADSSRNAERKQISRNVECPSCQVALIGVHLHVLRP